MRRLAEVFWGASMLFKHTAVRLRVLDGCSVSGDVSHKPADGRGCGAPRCVSGAWEIDWWMGRHEKRAWRVQGLKAWITCTWGGMARPSKAATASA